MTKQVSERGKTREADPVCFLEGTTRQYGKQENRVDGKDTNLGLIPSASVTDALIRQNELMLFCYVSSHLKPLLLHFAVSFL